MKTSSALVALALTVGPLHADFSSNQPATSVLGQPDFITSGMPSAAADNVAIPTDVAMDPSTGKVFVSDSNRSRVLRFSSVAAYQTGAAAEAVLGQATFDGAASNRGGSAGPNTMSVPQGIACDGAGRLWVPDGLNHRVLRFDSAATKANGADADGVLGQSSFTLIGAGAGTAGLETPTDISVDATGSLWVADFGNNRVLRFSSAAGRANGAPANQVLGQSTFATDASAGGAAGMSQPIALFVDGQLRLWVALFAQHRVLRFDNAAAKGDGGSADRVLGQADFDSTATTPITADSLKSPTGCVLASDGTLWVSDSGNRRVLGYRNAIGKTSGSSADLVLGQPGFDTADVFGASERSFNESRGLTVGRDGVLLVTDIGFNRILRFSPTVEITAPPRATARNGRATIRGTSKFASTVTFKGAKGGIKRAGGTVASWRVSLTGLKRPTTRVPVKAAAFDGRSARKVVVVKSRR